jgi:hypothetical protein
MELGFSPALTDMELSKTSPKSPEDKTSGEILEPAGEVMLRDIRKGTMEHVSLLHTEIMADHPRLHFSNVDWTSDPHTFILDARLVFTEYSGWQGLVPKDRVSLIADFFCASRSGWQELQRRNKSGHVAHTYCSSLNTAMLVDLVRQDLERISREIRKYYETHGSYSDAGNYHVAEMEFRRIRRKLRIAPLSRLALEVYKAVSNYGESPSRAMFCLLLLWFGSAIGYMYTGFGFGTEEVIRYPWPPQFEVSWPAVGRNLSNLAHALAYSFANLIPGYFRSLLPGQAPGRLTPFLALVEGVLGIGVLTLFLLAVRRRFRR